MTGPQLNIADALFRRLVEAAPDGIITVDRAGQVVLANAQAEYLFGYTPGELVGRSVEALVPEGWPIAHVAHRQDYYADARIRSMGMGLALAGQRRDGSTFPAEISLSPLPSEDGLLLICGVRDGTERRRTEEGLDRLAAIVESSDDAIIGKTLAGTITSWNRGAEILYGYSAAEAVGQPISLIIPPERPSELLAIMEQLRRGERIDHFETVRVRKDRTRVDVSVSISPIRDAAGRIVAASTIARDITERKRVEAHQRFLAEAGELLATSLDDESMLARLAALAVPQFASSCSVHLVQDGRLCLVAEAHTDAGEAPSAQAPGKCSALTADAPSATARVVRTGQAELVPAISNELLVDGVQASERRRRPRAAGPCSYIAVPLRARGRILGAITLVSVPPGRRYGPEELALTEEVARRVALAVDNAQLYQQLAERERQLQDLIGRLLASYEEERRRVAYEVHDGLAQVAAAAYQHLAAFTDHHRPCSAPARAALDRALELSRHTIGEARRVVAGLRPTTLDDFGLAAALRQQVEELRAEGLDATYDAALDSERLPPHVETALFRVVQEALTNVRKHAGPTRVHVALEHQGRRVRLEVRDWGCGFDPGAPLSSAALGERVGLAGMRERVALLGGRCEVSSRSGEGTRVVVVVPRSAADGGGFRGGFPGGD